MERRDRAREIHRHFRNTAKSTFDYYRIHNSIPEQDFARFGITTAATVSTKHYEVHVLSCKVFKYYPYTSLFLPYHCFHLFYIFYWVKLCLCRSNLFVYIVSTDNSNVVVYRIVRNLMALVAS